MALGSDLPRLSGYPFEVRYSDGALLRATAMAGIAADAYIYFSALFSGCEPDVSIVVLDQRDWPSDGPSFGMPYFSSERGDRPGVLVMPVEAGAFWDSMAEELRDDPLGGYATLRTVYSNGSNGVDLQPFIDLVTLHELAHAFEVLGDLKLRTAWLGEIFANLALHTFVATRRPASLVSLETFSTVGAASESLSARMRSQGYSTLDEFEAHYPGSQEPISWVNYVWFQYRWQRLAAEMFYAEGDTALIRFWECFHSSKNPVDNVVTADSLVALLTNDVSQTLGRVVRDWR